MPTSLFIFKTNLTHSKEYQLLQHVFSTHQEIKQWNMDLEDIDKVLRVCTTNLSMYDIQNMVQSIGLFCEELKN
jgi:hypothetical protein